MRNALLDNLDKDVWEVYDILRTALRPYEVKNVLLPMVTLKFFSENEDHGFLVPDESKWDRVTSTGIDFGERLLSAFRQLEKANPSLSGVFVEIMQHSIPRDHLSLFKVADSVLNRGSFKSESLHDPDLLTGTMAQYAEQLWNSILSREGVEGGEASSPRSVSVLLPRLLDKRQGSVYDGVSGNNDFLIEAYRYADKKGGSVNLHGQEINSQTRAFGIMNLILHGLYPDKAHIQLGHTITEPKWVEPGGQIMQFDGVLMNAPFGIGNWGYDYAEKDPYGRFRFGIPPKSSADMAFVLHALASTKKGGKAVVVVPHGALIRGASEGRIRAELIQADLIESVISLPSNLFIGTAIPVAVLVLNKDKSENLKDKVLVINAEEGFDKPKRNQKVLREIDIQKIVSTYMHVEEIEQYSRIVSISELAENEWNLHPLRYFEKAEVNTKIGKVEINRKQYEQADTPKVMLKDIADISRGFTPSKEETETEEDSHYLVNLSDVQEGKITPDALTGVKIDSKRAKEYELEPGDVLLSSRGTVLKVVVISENDVNDKPLIFSQNFIRIRVSELQCDPYFIKAFLESPMGQYYLEAYQKGTTVTVLSHKDVASIYIPLAPFVRQREIAAKMIKSEQAYEEAIRKAMKEQEDNYLKIYELMGMSESFKRIEK
jgi:type I restriction enzyme M protein